MPASKSSIILAEAAKLVEQGWCQDVGARDAVGQPVPYCDPKAASWCARGAIYKAARRYDWGTTVLLNAEDALREEIGGHIQPWNDEPGRKMADVASALRQAAVRG